MIVYGDRREWLTPALALARLRDAFARATCPPALGDQNVRHDALVELLIEAGALEQAVADSAFPEHDGHALPAGVVQLTDLAAAAVARSYDLAAAQPATAFAWPGRCPLEPAGDASARLWWHEWQRAVGRLLDDLKDADLPAMMEATLPEGYLFYALYPEAYLVRMRDLLSTGMRSRAVAPGSALVVVGVRSIGTSLGAIAAAAGREAGLSVRRLTLRPQGDPLAREVRAAASLVAEVRALAARGARFVLVDEGPGLSGSSLAGVARFLAETADVSPAAMAFLCANAWPGAAAPSWALGYWTAIPTWTVDGEFAAGALRHALAGRGGDPIAGGPAIETDLSGGAWRTHVRLPAEVATSHPRFERRKYLCRDARGQAIWAKFIGLGRIGRLKAQMARDLAERGYVPPVLGHARGFLLSAAISARPLCPGGTRPTAPDLQHIAAYYGQLATLPAPEGMGQPRSRGTSSHVHNMMTQNTRAWFGATLDRELEALTCRYGAVSETACTGGDGKPQPYEWLASSPLLKCDAADHYLDHGAVWPVDPAYDVAGTLVEWDLDPQEAALFVARYIAAGGDRHVAVRLPFYRAVYAAALLGQHDMAYHLEVQEGAGDGTARHDAARRRYAGILRAALTETRHEARGARR